MSLICKNVSEVYRRRTLTFAADRGGNADYRTLYVARYGELYVRAEQTVLLTRDKFKVSVQSLLRFRGS